MKSENNTPKPIKIRKMKSNNEDKHSSNDTIPSRRILLDHYKNNDIKIVRKELTERMDNNQNREDLDIQDEYITKIINLK